MITSNEGNAIALAAGYNLAKKMACVYMQNSGLGNAVNPFSFTSTHKVYSIPMLLLIGWRGSPFVKKDEPQHMVKGKITRNLLKLLDIKYCVLRNKRDLRKLSQIIKFGKKKKNQ